MTWLKIDDKLTSHPKWVGRSLEAKSLWFHAAVWCASHNTDGLLPPDSLPLHAFAGSIPPPMIEATCDELVRARLWHRVPKARGGGFEINDWLEFQPSRQQVKDRATADDVKAERKAVHQWLHKSAAGRRVKAQIDARDGMHCRYCHELTAVTPGDRRSAQRRTYDLVDPDSTWDRTATGLTDSELRRIADLWLVACGWCNAIKGSRTPDEAGLEILPVHRGCAILPRSAANGSGTVRIVGTGLVGSEPTGSDPMVLEWLRLGA